MANILVTICARGGSKGIPKKNIKLLNNRPLIDYTIKHAFLFKDFIEKDGNYLVNVALSTDCNTIKKVAVDSGLRTSYTRSEQLANDTAVKIPVIADVLNFYERQDNIEYDYIVDLDVSAPLRTVEEVIKAYQIINNDRQAFNIFSVSKAHKNPYFNVVELKKDGYYHLVKKSEVNSRQTAPQVYDMNASFYIYKKSFFENNLSSAITDKSLIYEMDHISFDLDEQIDFEVMDLLLKNNKLPFLV